MAKYRLFIKPSAVKEIEAISGKKNRQRIMNRIGNLSENQRPQDYEKLSGHDKYRVRQGPFRIVYNVDDGRLQVTIFKVGHRKDIYR